MKDVVIHVAKIIGAGVLALLTVLAANSWFGKDWGGTAFVLLWILWVLVLYFGWPIIEAIFD